MLRFRSLKKRSKYLTGVYFLVALSLWHYVREGGRGRRGEEEGGGRGGEMEERSYKYPWSGVLEDDYAEFRVLGPISAAPILSSHYVFRPPPRRNLVTGTSSTHRTPSDQHLTTPRDYFLHLKKPQFWCRKLAMLGGSLTCSPYGDEQGRDGNKLVCLDPPLDLPPGPDARQCLTLSFGTQKEVSFDKAVQGLPCEVHMFDVLDYKPLARFENPRHVYFHQVGLAHNKRKNFYMNLNETFSMDTLVGHLIANNITYRPVHILKVDIEGDEWEVFEHLAKEPILDIVGQIAVEVHVEEILKLRTEEIFGYLQRRYDILRSLETRGFLPVAYWDNIQLDSRYHAPEGSQHDVCGELLYVNTKWYNDTFKRTLRESGIPVKLNAVT
ncbi:probable methyltransferase-like protein 24 [Penaeus vannamei]|uniref:probable methyltransferase-like protein 24 n=1 Tax=Penaeus vannamei TaxID=6689 RepID=UPI00387F81F9